MGIEATQLIVGAVGGAIVQPVVGPWFAQRGERREVRAGALRAVSRLERARWAPVEWSEFRDGVSELWATALVAGIPRDLVETYVQLAYVARRCSDRSWEDVPDEEYGGGIPAPLSDLVRDAAELLLRDVWRPTRSRLRRRHDLKMLAEREELTRTRLREDGDRVDWTQWRGL